MCEGIWELVFWVIKLLLAEVGMEMRSPNILLIYQTLLP